MSRARLDYVAAEAALKGAAPPDGIRAEGKWPVGAGCGPGVYEAVNLLGKITRKLKGQREHHGALQLGSDELRWRVGADLHV